MHFHVCNPCRPTQQGASLSPAPWMFIRTIYFPRHFFFCFCCWGYRLLWCSFCSSQPSFFVSGCTPSLCFRDCATTNSGSRSNRFFCCGLPFVPIPFIGLAWRLCCPVGWERSLVCLSLVPPGLSCLGPILWDRLPDAILHRFLASLRFEHVDQQAGVPGFRFSSLPIRACFPALRRTLTRSSRNICKVFCVMRNRSCHSHSNQSL